MITVGSVAALVAFGLVVARIGWRSVLRYRGAQHVCRLVGRGPVDLTPPGEDYMTTTTDAVTRPDPGAVGPRAATILDAIHADAEFERLAAAAGRHADCWCTFNGYPIVDRFALIYDTKPLLAEAFKVLALKAAVLELSEGDDAAAELVVPVAVDEMVHAVVVQQPLAVQLQHRVGIVFVHMADHERFGWEPGDYTEDCYHAAGWGDPPSRYWVPAKEWMRRLGILDRRYRRVGVLDCGSRTEIDFDITSEAVGPAQ